MAMAGLNYEDSEIIMDGFRTQWAEPGKYELVERHTDGGATIKKISELDENRTDAPLTPLPDFHGVQPRIDWERERVSRLMTAIEEHMAADQFLGWAQACDWADELCERIRWLARRERNTITSREQLGEPQAVQAPSQG